MPLEGIRPKTLPSERLLVKSHLGLPSESELCIQVACLPLWMEAWREGLQHILGGSYPTSIWDWNDDPKRTWDEIIEKAKEVEVHLGWRP